MIFSSAQISNFVIHTIRENLGEKEVVLSESELRLDEDLTNVLKTYFFKKFERPSGLYQFSHEEDLSQNEVFSFCHMIFEQEVDFVEVSQAITNFLYTKSTSNAIKTGEVYITTIDGVYHEGETYSGIGIFKSENKDTFLKVFPGNEGIGIEAQQGININKLDKGAIIINTDFEQGYIVGIIDNTNKNEQAKYWKDEFLGVKLRPDDYNHTQQYIDAVRGYAGSMEEAESVEKIDFIQRSFEYLADTEEFKKNDFEEIVLQSQENIEGFNTYMEESIPDEYRFDRDDAFEVSKPAMKNNKRYIRSVIKLDKNFHIYVHGMRERIESGFDDRKQLKYYKLFFDDES